MKHINSFYRYAAIAATIAISFPAVSQIMPWENRTSTESDPFAKVENADATGSLSLEDVVGGKLLPSKGAGAINWLKDGSRYSRVEPNKETEGSDIVAYNAKDNKRSVLVPSSKLINPRQGNRSRLEVLYGVTTTAGSLSITIQREYGVTTPVATTGSLTLKKGIPVSLAKDFRSHP